MIATRSRLWEKGGLGWPRLVGWTELRLKNEALVDVDVEFVGRRRRRSSLLARRGNSPNERDARD